MEEQGHDEMKRSTGFGSSDATSILRFGRTGKFSDTLLSRVSEIKGLRKRSNVFSVFFDLGIRIEDDLHKHWKSKNFHHLLCNPLKESKTEYKNFKIKNHIDFEYKKISTSKLVWVELKSTKDDIEKTMSKYAPQLGWHRMIGRDNGNPILKLRVADTSAFYNDPDGYIFEDLVYTEEEYVDDGTADELTLAIRKLDEIWDEIPEYTEREVMSLSSIEMEGVPELNRLFELKKMQLAIEEEMQEIKFILMENMSAEEVKTINVDKTIQISYAKAGESSRADTKSVKEFMQTDEFKKAFPDYVFPMTKSARKASIRIKLI